jgi:hypothetical protein
MRSSKKECLSIKYKQDIAIFVLEKWQDSPKDKISPFSNGN